MGRIIRRIHQAGVYFVTTDIEQNSVEAKLVARAGDYVLSSASGVYRLDPSAFEETGAKALSSAV